MNRGLWQRASIEGYQVRNEEHLHGHGVKKNWFKKEDKHLPFLHSLPGNRCLYPSINLDYLRMIHGVSSFTFTFSSLAPSKEQT